MIKQVILIGAGRVGFHLGRHFHRIGIPVVQVFSRRLNKARELAIQLDCSAAHELSQIQALSDCLYVFAVSDDAIELIARQLAHLDHPDRFFVHTSGATSVDVLSRYFHRSGVLYPLQTFSQERAVDFTLVPLCIHTSRSVDMPVLQELAEQLSEQVYRIDDEQRAVLHVAAVFANNFVNHLYAIAQDILAKEGLPFDLLRPLIEETSAKVMTQPPALMQTGPAHRHDQQTIVRHLRYLSRLPQYQDIYRLLTRSIAEPTAPPQ